MSKTSPFRVFSGTNSRYLAEKICNSLGCKLGNMNIMHFADGEFAVSYEESIRGAHVFLVQSTFPNSDNLMELLLMIDAAKRASAKSIVAVIPYFGWARQDRKDKPRVSIGAKLVADLLSVAGIDRLIPYIFTLKPGDKVTMSGPYGDFHPIFDSKKEMIWVGGGAGMAPLRAQIMHMTKTLHTTDRELHYFYGARALNEVFYLQDFQQLEKDFPNFHFHLALDRPDPAADAAGVKYTAGFVHNVMYETYLKDHEAPEDIEYYMCGPGPMSNAVVKMLDSLGVEPSSIMYDNFGG